VVLLFGLDLSGSSDQLLGGLMVLGASLCYAIGAMLFKHKLPGAPPVGVAAGQMTVAAIVTLPLCLANLPDHAPSFKAVGSLVLLGVAGTGIAFLWFYTLISEIGPARASVISYIAPGFSVVYGIVLLGEGFSLAAIAGLGLILAGSWLAVGGRAKPAGARDGARADVTPVQEACAAVEAPAPVAAAAHVEG
jgi:drug/metabolite transporter (DMT)-like permease